MNKIKETLIEIPTDKVELKGFLRAIKIAIKIWNQGTQTYGTLTEYQRAAEKQLKEK